MGISFNDIPTAIRVPWAYIEFDASRAVQGSQKKNFTCLVMGQKTASGTATALDIDLISSADQAGVLYGTGSQLHNMFQAWKANNNFSTVYGMCLSDNGAGVAAAGSYAFTGTASESGTYNAMIAGRRIQVGITSGDNATTVGDALVAAIALDSSLPITAINTTGTVAITAKNKGLEGNNIDLTENYYEDEATPAGITVVITQMSAGATNPDITTAIAAIPEQQYDIVVIPWTDAANLALIEAELALRWGPLTQIDSQCFTAADDTVANLGTLGNSRNSPHVTIIEAYKSPSQPCEYAAEAGATAAFYGSIDPARPYQTLEFKFVKAPKLANRMLMSERNTLLYDGIATTVVNASGNVAVERLITTYKKNAAGADDTAYLDVNTKMTLSYLRWSLRNTLLRKFPRHKLANDGTRFSQGQAIVTPKVIRAEIIALFDSWEFDGLVEGIDQFKTDLLVERNTSDPTRLDISMSPDLVNQMRIFGAKIGFLL